LNRAFLRVFYPINVGDTVSPDVPLPGAGILGGGGIPVEHVYRFSGTAGEAVFFQGLSGDDCSGLQWRLRTPSGRTAFLAPLGIYCFPDPVGTHLLQETGEYSLIVSDQGFTTGTYSFRLGQPAQVETFSIAIGDIVDQGFPGAGSGVTETYDGMDVFSFTVKMTWGKRASARHRRGVPTRVQTCSQRERNEFYNQGQPGDRHFRRDENDWASENTHALASRFAHRLSQRLHKPLPVGFILEDGFTPLTRFITW